MSRTATKTDTSGGQVHPIVICLPPIEFEGKTIKAKSGFYKCPFSCGDSRFPARKWKSESGFRKHLTECPQRPEGVKAREEREAIQCAETDKKRDAAFAELTHKIGDIIFFVWEVVTKPTHEQRGNRLVHVRYEAEKRFDARQAVIESINYDGAVYFNYGIRIGQLCGTIEEARTLAQSRQKSYDDHVEFSSRCR